MRDLNNFYYAFFAAMIVAGLAMTAYNGNTSHSYEDVASSNNWQNVEQLSDDVWLIEPGS